MPVATRTRKSRVAVGAAVGATLALLLGISILAAVLSQNGCLGGGSGATPSGRARHEIPADFLALYQQIGPRYGIPWPILAGIGKEECDHGRNPDPSCTPEPGAAGPGRANFAGAAGPMQLGIGGAAGCAFCAVKTDANDDGSAGTHDPADAIAMAAKLLIEEKGAPRNAPLDAYRPAVTAYNGSGSAADAYAARVLADARAYASGDFTRSGAGSCSSASLGVPGKVVIAPGANRPGVQLQPVLLQYVAAMAGIYGKPIVITTGTNHDRLTVDGNVSDHWDGHAADIGMSGNGGTDGGPVGDRIMTACLLVAGESPRRAASEARRGGLYTLHHAGLRIQCIWKTYEGGDHYTHVHVGVQRE